MTTNNHPAHGPVSLDRLHQIREILSKASAQSDGGNLGYAMADAVKVIERVIAAFGAEPVLYAAEETLAYARMGELHLKCLSQPMGDAVIPLYAAPQLPQPAVLSVPAAMEMDDDFDSAFEHGKAVGWNAYRAAMLQAEPASNSDELPPDYLQGHKDGLEWAAQLAEANHPQTGDWLYDDPIELARAIRKGPDMPTVQDGKSPVAPGAWIPVSERMPEAEGRYWCYVEEQNCLGKSHYQWNCSWNGERWWVESDNGGRVTHWMELPAAPQQENI